MSRIRGDYEIQTYESERCVEAFALENGLPVGKVEVTLKRGIKASIEGLYLRPDKQDSDMLNLLVARLVKILDNKGWECTIDISLVNSKNEDSFTENGFVKTGNCDALIRNLK